MSCDFKEGCSQYFNYSFQNWNKTYFTSGCLIIIQFIFRLINSLPIKGLAGVSCFFSTQNRSSLSICGCLHFEKLNVFYFRWKNALKYVWHISKRENGHFMHIDRHHHYAEKSHALQFQTYTSHTYNKSYICISPSSESMWFQKGLGNSSKSAKLDSITRDLLESMWESERHQYKQIAACMYWKTLFSKTPTFYSISFWCESLAKRMSTVWQAISAECSREHKQQTNEQTHARPKKLKRAEMFRHAEREWQRSSHWSHCMLSSFTTIIIAIIGCAYYIYNIVSAMDIFIPRTLTIRFFLFVLNVCLLIFSSLYFHIFSVILLLLMISYVLWEKERFMCASVW